MLASLIDALIDALIARQGEAGAAATVGAAIGVLFGFFVHRSRFLPALGGDRVLARHA